ncbi:MAG: M23 family metallopeptidase [Geminicoccaceae bacterium]
MPVHGSGNGRPSSHSRILLFGETFSMKHGIFVPGAFIVALVTCPVILKAEEFRLQPPLVCEIGEDCWIVRYVDLDPGPGVMDYACGDETGDGHKGTDFAIPHLAAMAAGWEVHASASGKVKAVRDGMEDRNVMEIDREAIATRECGNGVVIEHEGGFETQYCHLRQGSVAVSPGDEVESGAVIGLVGLSGETSFPHVHVSVRYNDAIIDPFRGLIEESSCEVSGSGLWDETAAASMAYQPIILRNAGFATGALKEDDIDAGMLDHPPSSVNIPALVFAFDGFYLKKGDILEAAIKGPGGWTHDQREVVEAPKASFMRFSGRKAPDGGFPPGTYTARLEVSRTGMGMIARIERVVKLQ